MTALLCSRPGRCGARSRPGAPGSGSRGRGEEGAGLSRSPCACPRDDPGLAPSRGGATPYSRDTLAVPLSPWRAIGTDPRASSARSAPGSPRAWARPRVGTEGKGTHGGAAERGPGPGSGSDAQCCVAGLVGAAYRIILLRPGSALAALQMAAADSVTMGKGWDPLSVTIGWDSGTPQGSQPRLCAI